MSYDIPLADITKIYPTENDISLTPYEGISSTESNFSETVSGLDSDNGRLLVGLTNGEEDYDKMSRIESYTATTVTYRLGHMIIAGRRVECQSSNTETFTLPTGKGNLYLFAQLNISGGKVDGSVPVRVISHAVLSNSLVPLVQNSVYLGRVYFGTGNAFLDVAGQTSMARQGRQDVTSEVTGLFATVSSPATIRARPLLTNVDAGTLEFFSTSEDVDANESYSLGTIASGASVRIPVGIIRDDGSISVSSQQVSTGTRTLKLTWDE